MAEYTVSNGYFDYDKMNSVHYNPTLKSVLQDTEEIEEISIPKSQIIIEAEKGITKIRWDFEKAVPAEYMWLVLDDEYDMAKTADGYEASIDTNNYRKYNGEINIMALQGRQLYRYTVE